LELKKTYFFTSTILQWRLLLLDDKYKIIIIDSLRYLSQNNFINIYSFVIMPNHFHVIWELLEMNGKELPSASFMKYTSHQFMKLLKLESPLLLKQYEVLSNSRKHQFWQEQPLAIELYTDKVFLQKMDYIHNNPLQSKWELTNEPKNYMFSSAKFHETEIDEFGFLKAYSKWK